MIKCIRAYIFLITLSLPLRAAKLHLLTFVYYRGKKILLAIWGPPASVRPRRFGNQRRAINVYEAHLRDMWRHRLHVLISGFVLPFVLRVGK